MSFQVQDGPPVAVKETEFPKQMLESGPGSANSKSVTEMVILLVFWQEVVLSITVKV